MGNAVQMTNTRIISLRQDKTRQHSRRA